MGLLAWVLDALITWWFFPGRTFSELLFEYDSVRTYYVRALVVILFTLFGLLAGRLMSRLEESESQSRKNAKLLEGFRRLLSAIVDEQEEMRMIRRAAPIIRNSFEAESCWVLLLEEGEMQKVQGCASDGLGRSRDALEARLMDLSGTALLARWTEREGVHSFTPGHEEAFLPYLPDLRGGSRVLISRFAQQGQILGLLMLFGKGAAMHSLEQSALLQDFCGELGQGLSRIRAHRISRERNARLQTLTDGAPVGIFVTSAQGKIVFLNPRMDQLLRGQSSEVVDARLMRIRDFYVNPAQRDELLQALRSVGHVEQHQVMLRRLDGELALISLFARWVQDEDGGHIEGFARDITTEKQATAEAERLRERLNEVQKFRSIADLAGGFAHEFNNILQGMMGSAYLGQRLAAEEDSLKQYFQDIQESGRRASLLCEHMLIYSGRKAVEMAPHSLGALFQELRLPLQELIPDECRFQVELEDEGLRISVNVPAFREMMMQLLKNSVEAVKDQGLIRVQARRRDLDIEELDVFLPDRERAPGSYILISIVDSGPGMDAEQLSRIFEPFYSTKFPGRGLGLAAVQGWVQNFQAGIRVSSTVGEGSTFELLFPELLDENATRGKDSSEVSPQFRGRGCIWVVDDEPLICQTVERILHGWGFEARTSTEGGVAVQAIELQETAPLLVLLDVSMPGMNGPETLRELRKRHPAIRVVIMSGFDENESLAFFEKEEVQGFIHKPFQMDQLQRLLREVLPVRSWSVDEPMTQVLT